MNELVGKQASLMWLTEGLLYPEMESLFIAIQDGVVKTKNYLTSQSSMTHVIYVENRVRR